MDLVPLNFFTGDIHMDAKELADEIVGWIDNDIENGECDLAEWIADLKKYLEGFK